MTDFIMNPWPWYVAGPLITLIMFFQMYLGKKLGVSSNFQTMCSVAGANKLADYFRIDVKSKIWGFVFIVGIVIGGYISANYLSYDHKVNLSSHTVSSLKQLGFDPIDDEYVPSKIYDLRGGKNTEGILILLIGGIFVGFGARYANGCTSGHAISGTSNLQIPSFIALAGFFIGGLIMVYLIYPIIF